MKRIFAVILMLVVCGAVLAQNIILREGQFVGYKFVPRSWDFSRGDGPTITVMIDPYGTMTVLEDHVYVGTRYDSCVVAE